MVFDLQGSAIPVAKPDPLTEHRSRRSPGKYWGSRSASLNKLLTLKLIKQILMKLNLHFFETVSEL
jgi:hypothetical protein